MTYNRYLPTDYITIRDRIKDLYRILNTSGGEDGPVDRVEIELCGWTVRVRREVIYPGSDRTRVHLEYKGAFNYWSKTEVNKLTGMLFSDYRGML